MHADTSTTSASASAARIDRWLDLMRTSDKLFLAGLRRRVGPDGDVKAAYRQWYANHMREHDAVMERVALRLSDAVQESGDAR